MPPPPSPIDIDSRSDNHMNTTHTWLGASEMKLDSKSLNLSILTATVLSDTSRLTSIVLTFILNLESTSWLMAIFLHGLVRFQSTLQTTWTNITLHSWLVVCMMCIFFFLFLCYYTDFWIFRWLRRVENWHWAVSRPMLMISVPLTLICRIHLGLPRFKIIELEYTDSNSSIRYILAYLNRPDVHTQLGVNNLIYWQHFFMVWSGFNWLCKQLEKYHLMQLTGSLGDMCFVFSFPMLLYRFSDF